MESIEQRMFSVENSTNEALQVANEALTRINMLEKANTDKFQELIRQMGTMKTSMDKLFDRFWLIAVAAIGVLLAVSGYLYIESSRVNKEFLTQVINSVKQNPNGQ